MKISSEMVNKEKVTTVEVREYTITISEGRMRMLADLYGASYLHFPEKIASLLGHEGEFTSKSETELAENLSDFLRRLYEERVAHFEMGE